MNPPNTRIALSVLVALTTGLTMSCSSENDVTGDVTTTVSDTVTSRLITQFGADFHEAWICFDGEGEASGFTFYDKGTVEGLEDVRLGSEFTMRADVPPFQYAWSAIDNTSIKLQSPPLDVQDVWTNLEFSELNAANKIMRAVSESKGPISCTFSGERGGAQS